MPRTVPTQTQTPALTPEPNERQTVTIRVQQGAAPGDPDKDPSGAVIVVPAHKKIPSQGVDDLLKLLSLNGFEPYPNKEFSRLINAFAYTPSGHDDQILLLKKHLAALAKENKQLDHCLSGTQEDLMTSWFTLYSSADQGRPEIRLLAELLEKSLLVFYLSDSNQFLYEHIGPGFYQHPITGVVLSEIPPADFYFVQSNKGWLRVKRQGQTEQPLFKVSSKPSLSPIPQGNPLPAQHKLVKNGWAPENHEDLVKSYQAIQNGASITGQLVQTVFERGAEASRLDFIRAMIYRLAETGMLSLPATPVEPLALTKTLLEFLEGFWTDCLDLIYPDSPLPETRKAFIQEQVQASRGYRSDLTIGAVPSTYVSIDYLNTPLPTLPPLLKLRYQLFQVLADLVDNTLKDNPQLKIVVYGGMALRSHLLDQVFNNNLSSAIGHGLPAVNDIDLYCNDEQAMESILYAFLERVQKDTRLTVAMPQKIPSDNPELLTLKMTVRYGRTRVFTIDISYLNSSSALGEFQPDCRELPIYLPNINPVRHPVMPFIPFHTLVDTLVYEVKKFSQNVAMNYRFIKVKSALQRLFVVNQPLYHEYLQREGEGLMKLIGLPQLGGPGIGLVMAGNTYNFPVFNPIVPSGGDQSILFATETEPNSQAVSSEDSAEIDGLLVGSEVAGSETRSSADESTQVSEEDLTVASFVEDELTAQPDKDDFVTSMQAGGSQPPNAEGGSTHSVQPVTSEPSKTALNTALMIKPDTAVTVWSQGKKSSKQQGSNKRKKRQKTNKKAKSVTPKVASESDQLDSASVASSIILEKNSEGVSANEKEAPQAAAIPKTAVTLKTAVTITGTSQEEVSKKQRKRAAAKQKKKEAKEHEKSLDEYLELCIEENKRLRTNEPNSCHPAKELQKNVREIRKKERGAKPGDLTIAPETIKAVKKELVIGLLEMRKITGDSEPLTHPNQLFGKYSASELLMFEFFRATDFFNHNWYPATLLPERLGNLFIYKALSMNGVEMVGDILQIPKFSRLNKGGGYLGAALWLDHPVAYYWHALNSSPPDQLYLKKAALKLRQARMVLAENALQYNSDLYDPTVLFSIYKLSAKQKLNQFDQHLIKTDDMTNPRLSYAIDRALTTYFSAPNSPVARTTAAAWFLLALNDDYYSGISLLMEELGLQGYLPEALPPEKMIVEPDSHYTRQVDIITKSNSSQELAGALVACFTRKDINSCAERLLYQGKILDPAIWEKLRNAVPLISPVSVAYNFLEAIHNNLCFLQPSQAVSLLRNKLFMKMLQEKLKAEQDKPEVEETADKRLRWDFNNRIALLRAVEHSQQTVEGSALVSAQLSKIVKKSCVPYVVKYWTSLGEEECLLASPGDAGFTVSDSVLSDGERQRMFHMIPHDPVNPMIAEKLLITLLTSSRARITVMGKGQYYIQVFPEVLAKTPMRHLLNAAVAMEDPEACWLLYLSYGEARQYEDFRLLIESAQHMTNVRLYLLSQLLDISSPLFSPQLIPKLYQRFALRQPETAVRFYGISAKPMNVLADIVELDAILLEWAKKNQPMDFPFSDICDRSLRALVAVALHSVIPLDPAYHETLETMEGKDFFVECYFNLMIKPENYKTIRSALEQRKCLQNIVKKADPGGVLIESLAICNQALLSRLIELDSGFYKAFPACLSQCSEEDGRNLVSLLLHSPIFLFNEVKSAEFAEIIKKVSLTNGAAGYSNLGYWNSVFLPEYYHCLLELRDRKVDAEGNRGEKFHYTNICSQAIKVLNLALQNEAIKEPVKANYNKVKQLFLNWESKKASPPPSKSNSESTKNQQYPAFTHQWHARGYKAAESVEAMYSVDGLISKELLQPLLNMEHMIGQYYSLITDSTKGKISILERFTTILPAVANFMPALFWYFGNSNSFGSIASIEIMRSSFYSILKQQPIYNMSSEDFYKELEKLPELEFTVLFHTINEREEFNDLFVSAPSKPTGKLDQILAILTIIQRWITAVEKNNEVEIANYRLQLNQIQTLLAQQEESSFMPFLTRLMDPESLDGVEFKDDLDYDTQIILAAHLATSEPSQREIRARRLLNVTKVYKVSEKEFGRGLPWVPFIYGHYTLVLDMADILIQEEDYYSTAQLFAGTLDWYWKPTHDDFRLFIGKYLDFSMAHYEYVSSDELKKLIRYYCSTLIAEELDVLGELNALKLTLEEALKDEDQLSPLIDEIDLYQAYWVSKSE